VLAVGDALFQQKCLGKMGEVTQAGRTVLFVSHNMAAVRSLCNKGLLLEQGELVEFGDINRIIERYYLATGLAQQTTSAQSAEAAAGRPGFGPVRLGTGAGNTLEHSGPLAVKTSLYLERPSSGVSLFCILEDAQGNNIFHLREESSTYGWETNASGRYEIELTLPALWLNPGLYSLYFKVLLWQEYGSARYLSDRLLLDVTGKSSAVNALLHPQATWEFNHVATPLAEPACR
jgi:lipopolysaccharide transport system ATP-binding protein